MVQDSRIRGQEWGHAGRVMLVATVASLAVSFLLNYLLLFSQTLTPFDRGMATAIAVPLIVALPLSFLLARSWWQVRRYRRELTHSASYDRDTEFFNGAAFASVLDRRAPTAPGERKGAFLVVNADAIRSISRQYGLSWGEEALRVVAATIRSSVRSGDIVGRLGESEFGIYLPGATEANARDVGERIRAGVSRVYFAPSDAARGEQQPLLNVGVAGVIFEEALKFDRIYSAAEQSLADAEETADVEISHLGASEAATLN